MARRTRSARRAAPRSGRRLIVIRILAVVLTATLAVAAWSVWQRPHLRTVVYQGHRVDQPMRPLAEAEQQLSALVAQRHGVEASAARCYFLAASVAPSQPVVVSDQLGCGPALFLDGDSQFQYVTFRLSSVVQASGMVRLAVAGNSSTSEIASGQPGGRFVRPDGLRPPAGSGGLTLPPAPPAVADVLTRTATVGSPIKKAPADAVMIGPTSGVRLESFGFVERYGSGDQTRSAPAGRRLLAFRLAPIAGEKGAAPPQLFLRVGTTKRGPLVVTDDYVVTSVPQAGVTSDDAGGAQLSVATDLVLQDSDTEQSLSLQTGQPDGGNPQLASRSNRNCALNLTRDVTVQVKGATGAAGLTSGKVTFTSLSLSYWGGDGTHASSPSRALLHVMATVRLTGDKEAYGAESALLSASWSGGEGQARNAAADQVHEVDDVIDVPADLTHGTLAYSGSMYTPAGTLTVATPVHVPFTIAD
ncbi:MAG: hypothetical protein JWN95_344 [Frankiales bacterium]|nr:hypothetical protein [Frankiales bacterium]